MRVEILASNIKQLFSFFLAPSECAWTMASHSGFKFTASMGTQSCVTRDQHAIRRAYSDHENRVIVASSGAAPGGCPPHHI